MKKVTIQDIADALGISRNTVSKAINNSGGLADATRERILQKAVEMGYKHFSYVAAQAASFFDYPGAPPEPMGEIALFTANFFDQHHFAVLMLDRFKQELTQLGYTLNTYFISQENLVQGTLPATFNREQVSGIICIEMFDRAYSEMICGLEVPVLFVDGPHKRGGYSLPADQLYMDNTTAVTELVNDMLRKGKRNIGFIGEYEHCQSFFERYTAFRCAMLLAGAPVEEAYCIKINSTRPDALESALCALPSLPDLFICANDFIARDVMHILRKMGKSVPGDVLLCGFDDAPVSRILSPALTTVHIHTQIMAFTAVNLLISRIQEPELDYRTVYTQADLIYRDSTNF